MACGKGRWSYPLTGGSPREGGHDLLALLIYAYAVGVFSSRRIERATYEDVASRVLTADQHPDHDTIATFRRVHLADFHDLFVQVLRIAATMGPSAFSVWTASRSSRTLPSTGPCPMTAWEGTSSV